MGILERVYQFALENKPGKDNEFENLAIAIVTKAVEDYEIFRHAYQAETDLVERLSIKANMKEIENFFRSDYGDVLCFGHAAYVWDLLCKEYGGAG